MEPIPVKVNSQKLFAELDTNHDGVVNANDKIEAAIQKELGIDKGRTYTQNDIDNLGDGIIEGMLNKVRLQKPAGQKPPLGVSDTTATSSENISKPESQFNIKDKDGNSVNINDLFKLYNECVELEAQSKNSDGIPTVTRTEIFAERIKKIFGNDSNGKSRAFRFDKVRQTGAIEFIIRGNTKSENITVSIGKTEFEQDAPTVLKLKRNNETSDTYDTNGNICQQISINNAGKYEKFGYEYDQDGNVIERFPIDGWGNRVES